MTTAARNFLPRNKLNMPDSAISGESGPVWLGVCSVVRGCLFAVWFFCYVFVNSLITLTERNIGTIAAVIVIATTLAEVHIIWFGTRLVKRNLKFHFTCILASASDQLNGQGHEYLFHRFFSVPFYFTLFVCFLFVFFVKRERSVSPLRQISISVRAISRCLYLSFWSSSSRLSILSV